VFNAVNFIEKAVASALQFDEVKEVILVEDGSTDNSFDVCQKILLVDKRIKFYQHPDKKNHGPSASRNLGIEKSNFEYISFLDADDYYFPNRFNEDKIVFAKHSNVEGVYSAIGVDFYTDNPIDQQNFTKSFGKLTTVNYQCSPEKLLKGLLGIYKKDFGNFSLDGLTIKKSVLSKLPYVFNNDLRLHQDTEFIIRLSHVANLYPGSLKIPVTNRGVHRDNRITKVADFSEYYCNNQYLIWNSLYQWSKTVSLKNDIRKVIRLRYKSYFCHKENPKWSFVIQKYLIFYETIKTKDINKIFTFFKQRFLGKKWK